MKLRFTRRAAQQIEAALDEIAAASPKGAHDVSDRLLTIVAMLQVYPHAGRLTDKPGIRRIVVNPYPYLVDHSWTADDIVVRRFRHASRKPIP